jgi:hypothetical protein
MDVGARRAAGIISGANEMPDQTNNTPGGTAGAPAINPAPPPPEFNFVRERATQMAQQQPPAPGEQPQPEPEARQQQQETPPQKIKIGDAEYLESDVQAAIAERAEAAVRKTGLPSAPEGYEVKNSAAFQLPEGVSNFEFDMKDPTLAAARKFAMDRGLDQETFSGMLDLFVASKSGELLNQARARDANLRALGAAGPQRVEAIATWLGARAGKEGVAVGNFLRQFPSAPIVRAMETLIKQFSSQGGATFSQQHRESADAEPGKIPGYENMSFAQKRAYQMAQMMSKPGYRGGGGRRE